MKACKLGTIDAIPKMSGAVTGVLTLLFAVLVSIAGVGGQTTPVQTVPHAFTSKNDRKCKTPQMALNHSDQYFGDYPDGIPTQSAPTARHVSFPQVHDWNSVCITLSRTVCFTDQCPAYRIEIHGDGTILYEGAENVVVKGQHRTSTTPDKVRQLVNAFRDADYYSLRDYYQGEMFGDAPTYQTSIEIDGQVKQVRERMGGPSVGMSATVSKLENAIDTLANAQQWIGNPPRVD
jgi:hypothetical protein